MTISCVLYPSIVPLVPITIQVEFLAEITMFYDIHYPLNVCGWYDFCLMFCKKYKELGLVLLLSILAN